MYKQQIQKCAQPMTYLSAMVLAVGLLISPAWFASTAAAQSVMTSAEGDSGTITVVGEGKVTIEPDIARANIGVEVSGNTVADASAESKALIQAIVTVMEEQGIAPKDIQTSNFNIYAERYGPEGPLADDEIQYRVNNMVMVVIRDLDRVGDILDAAIEAGANSIYGVTFQVEDPSSVESDARQRAVEDARAKAEELASLTGVGIGNVISISEVVGGNGGYYQSNFDAESAALGSGGDGFSPGELSLVMRLQISYAIAQQQAAGTVDETTTSVLPASPFANMTYAGIYEEPVTLTDGSFEGEPFVEGGASRPTVQLTDVTAMGDLNGDGIEDGAVILTESSGGSGTFYYLAAVIDEAGEFSNVSTTLLGDRTRIESLRIEEETIVVELVTHGPDDALCCPTQEEIRTYELIDGTLVDTATASLLELNPNS